MLISLFAQLEPAFQIGRRDNLEKDASRNRPELGSRVREGMGAIADRVAAMVTDRVGRKICFEVWMMTRLIDRRRRLAFETPLLIGKRPLIVTVEPWGLSLREKGRRAGTLAITWAQAWNRAAVIAADERRAAHGRN